MTTIRGHHQAVVRKDGPVHAHPFISKKEGYLPRAVCGIPVGPLAQTKAKLFQPQSALSCKRCAFSITNHPR